MTLHGMLQQNSATRINFVFPAQAIWVEDLWVPGDKRPYPAPMVLLATLFARGENDAQRYDEVVVPFLDPVITQYTVLGYPPDPPAPPLSDLLKGWSGRGSLRRAVRACLPAWSLEQDRAPRIPRRVIRVGGGVGIRQWPERKIERPEARPPASRSVLNTSPGSAI